MPVFLRRNYGSNSNYNWDLMKSTKSVHLLLRFSDRLLTEGNTITEHNLIAEREGSVWFGKMGSPVSRIVIDRLNDQVNTNIPTSIYLVKGNRKKQSAFIAELITASTTLPKQEENLVPIYYEELGIRKYIKFWVKVELIHPLDFSELQRLRVASSVFPLPETLYKSSCGHFLVKENTLF